MTNKGLTLLPLALTMCEFLGVMAAIDRCKSSGEDGLSDLTASPHKIEENCWT